MISSGSSGTRDEILRAHERAWPRVASLALRSTTPSRGGRSAYASSSAAAMARLLLGARRRVGSRRRACAPGEHRARDLVHLRARGRQLALRRARGSRCARQRRDQREGELLVVERRRRCGNRPSPRARASCRARSGAGDTALARLVDRALEPRLLCLRQSVPSCGTTSSSMSDDHAGVLLRGGFGVDRRHARRIERLAHLREEPRQLVQARAARSAADRGSGAKSRASRP